MIRRGGRRWVKKCRLGLIVIFIVLLAWIGGLYQFASLIPDPGHIPNDQTDAIVVLTGGAGRVGEGLSLLKKGLARQLFVSGVHRGVDVQALRKLVRRAPENLECCIALGYAANSTRGNARETADWIRREKISSIRLVTASYHMPRSLLEFHRVLPKVFRIVVHPVFPPDFYSGNWWRWRGSAQLAISEYHKYLLAILEMKLM